MNRKSIATALPVMLILGSSIAAWAACTPANKATTDGSGCTQGDFDNAPGAPWLCTATRLNDGGCGDLNNTGCTPTKDHWTKTVYSNDGASCTQGSGASQCGTSSTTPAIADNGWPTGTECTPAIHGD